MRTLGWALTGAAAVVAVVLVVVWSLQRHLIYVPDPTVPGPADSALPGAVDVDLATADGLRLGAWWVPPRGQARDLAVLVANGNGGQRALRAPLADALSRQGLGVLLFDYRGYGGNAGTPSEEGLALDVRAAHRHLVADRGMPSSRIVYVGESLGGAVVADLAVEHPPGGLLLRSPFVDLASAGAVHYPFLPVRLLLRDRFPVVERVARINVPTTVVWGTDDRIIPPAQSAAVAMAAAGRPTRTVVVPGADHNDPALLDGPALVAAVTALADAIASR